ncbi:DUF6498-containing protein [Nocardioides xinjiangensis]|uniref:DUF6498-containing protein n=1 Tax=Nocardioides xinjiangensis TaxID=2817376 RepID=UPI001B30159C|nr:MULTISPECIES: DUF6498-containing protein [unclassified Nocardioides]
MVTGEQGLPRAPLLSSLSLVAGNLSPLWAVRAGHMSVGDVFVTYWIENLAYWVITIVKVRTARGPGAASRVRMTVNGKPVDASRPGALASFFAFHYGIFTLVHGVFAFALAFLAGGELHPATWVLAGLALALSHLGSLWLNWFDGGERWRVSPATAMWQPYPRMLVLHVAIIVGFGLTLRSVGSADAPSGLEELAPVLLLLGSKTVVDLGLHLWERRRAGSPAAAAAA